jgi:hypothetical protein
LRKRLWCKLTTSGLFTALAYSLWQNDGFHMEND